MQTMGEGEVGKVPIRQEIKGKKKKLSRAWGSTKEKMRIKRKVKFRVLGQNQKRNIQI